MIRLMARGSLFPSYNERKLIYSQHVLCSLIDDSVFTWTSINKVLAPLGAKSSSPPPLPVGVAETRELYYQMLHTLVRF